MTPAAEKRKEKARRIRADKMAARADVFFIIYFDMGPERSLDKLEEYVSNMGLKKSAKTFRRWSVQYDWQQRVVEESTRRHEQDLADAGKRRSEMMTRQAKIGRTMQTLAVAGMLNLQDRMKSGRLDIDVRDIANLAKHGAELERVASGEPTHKIEITTILYNVLIARIARIFKEANVLPTAEGREDLFATRVDQVSGAALEEVNSLMLEQGKG